MRQKATEADICRQKAANFAPSHGPAGTTENQTIFKERWQETSPARPPISGWRPTLAYVIHNVKINLHNLLIIPGLPLSLIPPFFNTKILAGDHQMDSAAAANGSLAATRFSATSATAWEMNETRKYYNTRNRPLYVYDVCAGRRSRGSA
jgi:hypothetical protein